MKFTKVLQSKAIGTNVETGEPIRKSVYYPAAVDLENMSTRQLVNAIKNMGSSAYSKGELLGVSADLGNAIATQLIASKKVTIDGLGTFVPSVKSTLSNVTDPSKLSKDTLYLDINFTPDDEFALILANVEFENAGTSEAKGGSDTTYTMSFSKQDKNNNLKFVASDSTLMANWGDATVTATVNGESVASSNISLTSAGLFLNDQVSTGYTLTNATVIINMPAISYTVGEETYEYAAAQFTFTNVTQTGSSINLDA